jgi:sugar phosphate isomerase/epimerase
MVNRREFLERTALGAVAVAWMRSSSTAAAQSAMYISLPPWAVARNVGWPDQARLAAKVGYGGIDWAWQGPRQAGVDATKALMADLKIRPSIVNLPGPNIFMGDEAAFKARLPQLDEDAAFCKAVGCGDFMMTLGATVPAGQTKDERWAFVKGRLAAVSEILVKHDARLGLEFLGPLVFRSGRGGGGRAGAPPADLAAPPPPPPVPFVYTLTETVKLCQDAGPNLGATLDAWHWFHSGGTVADILATDPKRIIHVHVSDAKAMPPEQVQDNMRWMPGEGVIDLVGFFGALKKIGWSGGVAPEVIGSRVPDDMAPEESARIALAATTAVMKKAGAI